MAKGSARKNRNKTSQPQTTTFIPQPSAATAVSSPSADEVPANDKRSVSPPVTSQINARPYLETNGFYSKRALGISAIAHTLVPMWIQTLVMIGLIFGGCCTNVFSLEAIVKEEPQSGNLITFAQFLFVAAEGLYHHFDRNSPTFLKPNQIPFTRWLRQIILFFSVSVLNNYAFGFSISVPVHIILRSGGSMTTMLIGWLFGKKYSRIQVLSVLILSFGIVISALGDAKNKNATESSTTRFIAGLSILFVAQVLSAFMGLYVEETYSRYGSNWREGLFYTHALALLLFTPFWRGIYQQFNSFLDSPPLPLASYASMAGIPPPQALERIKIPRQIFLLVSNAVTQYACIRGVNVLGSVSSALTVTIVLNIRKLVSLLLSVWLFGNELHMEVLLGAAVVFGGAFIYGIESQRQKRIRNLKAKKSQ